MLNKFLIIGLFVAGSNFMSGCQKYPSPISEKTAIKHSEYKQKSNQIAIERQKQNIANIKQNRLDYIDKEREYSELYN